jgi:hypothetical protein
MCVMLLRETTGDSNAVETIALNFSEWESKQAQDKYSLECHRHAHLILSQFTQARLVLAEATKEKWVPLNGHYSDPPHYTFNAGLFRCCARFVAEKDDFFRLAEKNMARSRRSHMAQKRFITLSFPQATFTQI